MSDMRDTIATAVVVGLRRYFVEPIEIGRTATTSDCPIVELKLPSGDAYNITITKARTRK